MHRGVLGWIQLRSQPDGRAHQAPSKDVSIGSLYHSCGLRTSTAPIICWGSNNNGTGRMRPEAPSAPCPSASRALLRAEEPAAPSAAGAGSTAPTPRETRHRGLFTSISAGDGHTCGVRTSGSVVCWGNNLGGQTDAPRGAFSAVSGGYRHSCGLRTDNTIRCWGSDNVGESDAPSGAFSAVSAGLFHSCGLRTDNTISCWGANDRRPVGSALRHLQLQCHAGYWHTCGLANRQHDQLLGGKQFDIGQTESPSGTFTSLDEGGSSGVEVKGRSCAVRTDGAIVCWHATLSYRR